MKKFFLRNGNQRGKPAASSRNTVPSAHISGRRTFAAEEDEEEREGTDVEVDERARRISGARYSGVVEVGICASAPRLVYTALPKSMTLIGECVVWFSNKMFSSFRSLCTMSCKCKYLRIKTKHRLKQPRYCENELQRMMKTTGIIRGRYLMLSI